MFENDKKIIKIDGKDRFLEITEFFAAGKVSLQFSTYNKNAEPGSRLTNTIKIYMNLEDLAYFAHILEDEQMLWNRIRQAAQKTAPNADIVVASFYSGSEREGQVYSRQLTIEKGQSLPVIIRARECPGIKTATGAVTPDKTRKNEMKQVIIGISMAMAYKISYACKRAISIYDRWVADRVLDERLASINYNQQSPRQNAQQQPGYTGGYPYQRGYNYAPQPIYGTPYPQEYQAPIRQ